VAIIFRSFSHFSTWFCLRTIVRTIDAVTSGPETVCGMARFSSFLGRRVEVQYRASDTLLPASGVFVADSGRSIFLEESFEQRGQHRHFRWEIPYQHLVRIGLSIREDEDEPFSSQGIPFVRNKGQRAPANTMAPGPAATCVATALGIEAGTAPAGGAKVQAPPPPPKETLASSAAAGLGLVSTVLPLRNRSKTA
jgi:hypothetical protein